MESPVPDVTISIVTWNSEKYIGACLGAVFRQSFDNHEVVVVDNASQDGTVNIIRRRYKEKVRLVVNDSNEGYCRAHNNSISSSRGEFVLTLNPDVVLEPPFLVEAIGAMKDVPNIGSVNGRLLRVGSESFANERFEIPNSKRRVDSVGLLMYRSRRQYLRGYLENESEWLLRSAEIFGPDGAAALYRREMLEDIRIEEQYFDEGFFAHKEDVDLAWRSQLLGWRSVYAPDAVAYHVRGFRPGKRQKMAAEIKRHAVKNRYLMLIKNELPETLWRDWPRILFYDLRILIYILLFERNSVLALWDFLRLAPRALRWRKEIMRRRRASPSYMESLFQ